MKISKFKKFILAVIVTLLGIGLFFARLFIPPDKFIKFKDNLLKE